MNHSSARKVQDTHAGQKPVRMPGGMREGSIYKDEEKSKAQHIRSRPYPLGECSSNQCGSDYSEFQLIHGKQGKGNRRCTWPVGTANNTFKHEICSGIADNTPYGFP